jgi:hypothetical protein
MPGHAEENQEVIDPADFPPGMHRGTREIQPEFAPDECCYCRFDPVFVQSDYTIDPLHIKSIPCPDLSSNRSQFSTRWDVLYPLARFQNWAIFKFRVQDVPTTVRGDSENATVHDVKTEHDPQEYNYGHCETRVYRNGKRMDSHLKPGPKDKLRLIFSRLLTIERRPGDGVPPLPSSPITD